MKVEVEIQDLETIVFATAAIKKIETALSTRKHDPFVKPYLEFNEAHNNLTTALTHAKRSQNSQDYATPWDGELSIKEIKYLQDVSSYTTYKTVSGDERNPASQGYNDVVDSLMAKGCIKMGQLVSGIVWAGEEHPFLEKMPSFGVAITLRGRTKLTKVVKDRVTEVTGSPYSKAVGSSVTQIPTLDSLGH